MDDVSILGEALRCASCGHALDGDLHEDPTGDAGRPICGNCDCERNFFDMDITDGVLDDNWGPDRGRDRARPLLP